MNKATRILYSAKHARRMKLFERQFLRRIYNALQSQIIPVLEVLRRDGIHAAIGSVDRLVINEHLAPVIQDIYKTVGLHFANKTIADINKTTREQKAGFGFNLEFLNSILQYFASFLLNKAVLPITQTTQQQILDALNEGLSNGWGADRIANELEISELTLARAKMIVRTEANKAMNYGQKVGEQKSNYESVKIWIAANDHRTRHSHRVVDDETIDFNKYFHVPIFKGNIQMGNDLMDGPGDIHATAGNVINCRCVLAFQAKRDENGRLIRKKVVNSNISVILPHEINRSRTVITI